MDTQKVLGAIVLLLATTVPAMAETIPLPRPRPVGIPGDLVTAETAVSPCRSRLAEVADFKPLPSITGPGDCTATDVVALDAVFAVDRRRIAISPANDRRNDAELGAMSPDCMDHRGLLSNKQVPRAMEYQTALLFR
jgi:hypothetical protein